MLGPMQVLVGPNFSRIVPEHKTQWIRTSFEKVLYVQYNGSPSAEPFLMLDVKALPTIKDYDE